MSLSAKRMEIDLLASSLTSIAYDLERGERQFGDELKGDEDAYVGYLAERLTNVETLLQRIRLDLWSDLTEAKLKALDENDAER